MNNNNIMEMVEKARQAQIQFENATQQQVDTIARALGKIVYDRAEELSKMAVEETGMGCYEDKVRKCKGKSKLIWNSLKGKKSVGIIEENFETGILKVAKPKGVIGAITPSTNPVVTPMCNAMFALKGRNAIIILPHPKGKNVAKYLAGLFRQALRSLDMPEDLIQSVDEPSTELRGELARSVDVVVATGGMGVVRAAYSSGKPALGVGPGNVQCIIDRGVCLKTTVPKIVEGRIFDNGIICSSEQSVIIPSELYDETIQEFVKNGAYYIDDEATIQKFASALFVNGVANREVVGQSIEKVAAVAGVDVPKGTKVIILKARGIGKEDILCREKMCPVLVAIPYHEFEEAVDIAQANLNAEGKGHSCALHSLNMDHIRYAGDRLAISRLTINQASSVNTGGSLYNGFAPTTTLGCGSWGNNSISENLNYTHLLNISQIGLYNEHAYIPTDEEIWNFAQDAK